MTDQTELIQRLQTRDSSALAELFETQSDKIYRLAIGILHDEQQADGVVQDTFVKLIESIDTFEGRSLLDTWLYRVAYNECLGRLRRTRPNVGLDDLLDDDFMPDNFIDWEQLPEAALRSQETRQQMDEAVAALPPNLGTVFKLRDVEELSTRETAQILQISESAVKVRLHRARLMLREALADYFQEHKTL